MPCRPAPAHLVLRDELDAIWPDRDRASDGFCASAKHHQQNPTSDHEPVNGYAAAFDIDEDIAAGLGSQELLFLVPILLRDDRTKYEIYERRIWYATCRLHGKRCWEAGGHPYNGANPHDTHLHHSMHRHAIHDTRPWGVQREEPDVTRDQEIVITKTLNAVEALVSVADRDTKLINDKVLPRLDAIEKRLAALEAKRAH